MNAMIKLVHLNKFFNKNKANQIHVINDTTLEFPEKGLVALTGPSGCGKTTLLNVIGGLDKFDSGEIHFDEQVLSRYRPMEWDIIRNQNVGYIFQNYNLVVDKTVYENVELALNMAGLYNKEDIEKRINYVLESVGMYNYRRRNVQALSGGQQQRVAIARAIAKNPKVVLADEPTGNLDANNTFEVMSIIKKISQERLVILVSHERSLVDFYADRVIELSDGKVTNDYENVGNRSFEHVDERIIYLKDLNKDEELSHKGIERYYDHNKDETLNFQIVEVKDSIYIKANSLKKVKYLTDETEIRLLDEHYKAKQSEDVLEYSFDLDQFGTIKHTGQKKSFVKMKNTILNGFSKAFGPRRFVGKLFLLAYFVISALIAYQIASFGNLIKVDESQYMTIAKDLVRVDKDGAFTSADIDYITSQVDHITWSPYYLDVGVNFLMNDLYQGDITAGTNAYPVTTEMVDAADLIAGDMPTSNTEVVVDKQILEVLLAAKNFTDLNITDMSRFIGEKMFSSDNSYYMLNGSSTLYAGNSYVGFDIVGIIDTGSPTIVVTENALYSFLPDAVYQYMPYGTAENRVTITEGRGVQADNEIMIGDLFDTNYDVGDTYTVRQETYTIVGRYTIDDEYLSRVYRTLYVVSNHTAESWQKLMIEMNVREWSEGKLYYYSDNINKAIEDISALDGYTAQNAYQAQYQQYQDAQISNNLSKIRSIAIILIGIVIYIFFMMRSSMLNRIREIGIYRSIGATKRDIYKIFFGEILAMTTLGSLTGYLVMSALISRVQNMVQGTFFSLFYFPWYYFLGGILFIYLINILFGMIPILTLLRKTPSEINAKYDI